MSPAPGPVVRRATADDATAIADVAAATFALACPPSTSPADIAAHIRAYCTPAALRRDLSTEGHVFYVADHGGSAVGFAMLAVGAVPPVDLDAHAPVELKRIYVAAEQHGTGIATALMETSVQHARGHGADLIWLGTNQANHRALAFYRRHGFEIAGSRTFTVGASVEDDYVLVRPLD